MQCVGQNDTGAACLRIGHRFEIRASRFNSTFKIKLDIFGLVPLALKTGRGLAPAASDVHTLIEAPGLEELHDMRPKSM